MLQQLLDDVRSTLEFGRAKAGLTKLAMAPRDELPGRVKGPFGGPGGMGGGGGFDEPGGGNVVPFPVAPRSTAISPRTQTYGDQMRAYHGSKDAAGNTNVTNPWPFIEKRLIEDAVNGGGHYAEGGAVMPDQAAALAGRTGSAPIGNSPGMVKLATLAAAKQQGGTSLAWRIMQKYRKQYDAGRSFALAALTGSQQKPGNLQASVDAINKVYADVPDGKDVNFKVVGNAIVATVSNSDGTGTKRIPLSVQEYAQFLQGRGSQFDHLMDLGVESTLKGNIPQGKAAEEAPEGAIPDQEPDEQPVQSMADGGPVLNFDDGGLAPEYEDPYQEGPAWVPQDPEEARSQWAGVLGGATSGDTWREGYNGILSYLTGKDAADDETEYKVRTGAGIVGSRQEEQPSAAETGVGQGETYDVRDHMPPSEKSALQKAGFTPEEEALYHMRFGPVDYVSPSLAKGYGYNGGSSLDWLIQKRNEMRKATSSQDTAKVNAAAGREKLRSQEMIATEKIKQLDRSDRSKLVAHLMDAQSAYARELQRTQLDGVFKVYITRIQAGEPTDADSMIEAVGAENWARLRNSKLLQRMGINPGPSLPADYGSEPLVNPNARVPTMPGQSGGPPQGWAPPGFHIGDDGKVQRN